MNNENFIKALENVSVRFEKYENRIKSLETEVHILKNEVENLKKEQKAKEQFSFSCTSSPTPALSNFNTNFSPSGFSTTGFASHPLSLGSKSGSSSVNSYGTGMSSFNKDGKSGFSTEGTTLNTGGSAFNIGGSFAFMGQKPSGISSSSGFNPQGNVTTGGSFSFNNNLRTPQ